MKEPLPDFWCFNRLKDSKLITHKNIKWKGPFAWPSFEAENNLKSLPNGAGIYLFTYNYKEGFIIRSVGVTNSFKRRFSQHTREYRKGHYTVLDVNFARQGERRELWHGWEYAKQYSKEFFRNEKEIMQFVDKELEAFRLFIAIEEDQRKRERIEFAIMHHIYGAKEPWSDLVDGQMFLRGRANSEVPIKANNLSQEKIFGLPGEIEF